MSHQKAPGGASRTRPGETARAAAKQTIDGGGG